MNDSELFSLAQLTGFDSTKEMYVHVLIMNEMKKGLEAELSLNACLY